MTQDEIDLALNEATHAAFDALEECGIPLQMPEERRMAVRYRINDFLTELVSEFVCETDTVSLPDGSLVEWVDGLRAAS